MSSNIIQILFYVKNGKKNDMYICRERQNRILSLPGSIHHMNEETMIG